MPSKVPEAQIFQAFKKLPKNPSLSELHEFVNENFAAPGYELDYPDSHDWKNEIALFQTIVDPDLLEFSKVIHAKWKNLIRMVNFSRLCDGCVSSHLNLKYPFVIPGGRFREFYYWDTFWILEGLLISEMWETARGILMNFFDIIQQYGFVPNGSRIYYMNRSQPPLLAQMVKIYLEYTSDFSILPEAISALDTEYQFWMKYRSVELSHPDSPSKKYVLNVYRANNFYPRPESLVEDLHFAQNFKTDMEKAHFFWDIASAAESGWDFSSRWFKFNSLKERFTSTSSIVNQIPLNDLILIDITSLIPLDLNAILFSNENILSQFHELASSKLGLPLSPLIQYYKMQAKSRFEAMKRFLWSFKLSMWSDYNFITKTLRNEALWDPNIDPIAQLSKFYLSDFSPLWYMEEIKTPDHTSNTETRDSINEMEEMANMNELVLERLLDFIESTSNNGGEFKGEEKPPCVGGYPGGIPISRVISGQQWDFPNAWAPFQYYLVKALLNKSKYTSDAKLTKRLRASALEISSKWIKSTYCCWKRTGHFFEKYHVLYAGIPGEGGEYIVQDGFGWTNAVIMSMLKEFATELKIPSSCNIEPVLTKTTFVSNPPIDKGNVEFTTYSCLKNLKRVIHRQKQEPILRVR